MISNKTTFKNFVVNQKKKLLFFWEILTKPSFTKNNIEYLFEKKIISISILVILILSIFLLTIFTIFGFSTYFTLVFFVNLALITSYFMSKTGNPLAAIFIGAITNEVFLVRNTLTGSTVIPNIFLFPFFLFYIKKPKLAVSLLGFNLFIGTFSKTNNSENIINTVTGGVLIITIFVSTIILIIQKIQQYKAEESMRAGQKEQTKFFTVFENSPIGMAIVKKNYSYVNVNKAFCKMLGYSKEELLGSKFTDITHADELQEDLILSQRVFSGELPSYSLEKRYKTKRGEYIWTKLTTSTISNDGIIFGLAMIEDITESRKAQKAIQESEERYRKLVEYFPEGILVHQNEKIVYVNDFGVELLGYDKKEDLIGTPVFNILHPRYKKIVTEIMKKMRETFAPIRNREDIFIKKNGSHIDVEVTAIPVIHKGKTAFQINFRDVSQSKKAKKSLIKAKETAEKSKKFKDQFVANLSHEIRTPMNAIMGILHLLDNTKLTKLQREYINTINTSSNHLLIIINDILDISKIEAGKIKFYNEPFNLNSLVKALIRTLRISAENKGLQIKTNFDTSIPILVGDPVRLNQILMNLVSNSIKFTEDGEVNISTKMTSKDTDTVNIELKVEDTGIGIPLKNQKSIFNSFTQIDENNKGGTGLGLTIVKRLVNLMNGEISLKSKIQKGTVFTLNIPFELNSKNTINKSKDNKVDLKDKKVLIVEDNKINQLVLKSILHQWGIKYEIVDNGYECIEKLNRNTYDLILMDIKMPILNGFETTKKIRLTFDSPKKDIPIIALSAYALEDEKKKALKSGMNSYLPKPINPEELYASMFDIIKQ